MRHTLLKREKNINPPSHHCLVQAFVQCRKHVLVHRARSDLQCNSDADIRTFVALICGRHRTATFGTSLSAEASTENSCLIHICCRQSTILSKVYQDQSPGGNTKELLVLNQYFSTAAELLSRMAALALIVPRTSIYFFLFSSLSPSEITQL